jgi:hypothetical protein
MRKKRARKSWSLPIENVPGLVLHANAKGTTLPIENVKIDPERRVIYGFVHAKHDGGSPTIERLKALDRATRRGILGLPPPAIDKKRLAERVLQGQPLREHEAQFVADLLTGKKRRASARNLQTWRSNGTKSCKTFCMLKLSTPTGNENQLSSAFKSCTGYREGSYSKCCARSTRGDVRQ